MIRTAPDFTEMLIDLEVWDLKHLNRLLSQLKDNSSVSDARARQRLTTGSEA